jgi:hypothetical protein
MTSPYADDRDRAPSSAFVPGKTDAEATHHKAVPTPTNLPDSAEAVQYAHDRSGETSCRSM